jgi:hypothetical protein
LALGLDDGWNIAVGVAQKFPSLAAPPRWSEQRTPLLASVSKLSATIRAFSSAVHRRRRLCPVITSI